MEAVDSEAVEAVDSEAEDLEEVVFAHTVVVRVEDHSAGRVPGVCHRDLQEVRIDMLLLTEDGHTEDITGGIIADLGIPDGITTLGSGVRDGVRSIIRLCIWAEE